MKYFELTNKEKKILEDFEKGEFVSAKNLKQKKKIYQKYAQNTLSKKRNINIRLSERDLQKLRAKAAEIGIPYQTLAASILHRCTDKREITSL